MNEQYPPFQGDDLHGEIMQLLEALTNLIYSIEADALKPGKVRSHATDARECLRRLNDLLT